MMSQENSNLDPEELLHCAMAASAAMQHDRAIDLFKRSIEGEAHPAKHLMLAAEYAQVKLFDRAIQGMKKAIEMEPLLWVAHFQLSQVYLVSQKIAEAREVWQYLASSPEAPDYFQLFSSGLLLITEEKYPEGIQLLEKGKEKNNENPALNSDIDKIIQLTSPSDTEGNTTEASSNIVMNEMLLSKYGSN
ncbi:hypothetical protein ACJJIQ_14590 [Microbulbifer sp. ANSA003]|uniref:hypothetical protein n=2 Tax=Microbulbifer TaxID=48073 RepID=UPI0040393EED